MNRERAKAASLKSCEPFVSPTHPTVHQLYLMVRKSMAQAKVAPQVVHVDYCRLIPEHPRPAINQSVDTIRRMVHVDMAAAEERTVSFLLGYKGCTFIE